MGLLPDLVYNELLNVSGLLFDPLSVNAMCIAEVLVIGDEGVLTGHLSHGGEVCGNGPVLLYLHLLIDFLYNKLHEHILNLCLRLIGNLICISMLVSIQRTEGAIELRVLVISIHVVGGGYVPLSMGLPR